MSHAITQQPRFRRWNHSVSLIAFLAVIALAGCAASPMPAAIPVPTLAVPPEAQSPDGFSAYLNGRFAQDQKDYKTAIALYQAALGVDPNNPEILNRIMLLAANEGHFDIAGPLADRVLALSPDNAAGTLIKGTLLLKAGKPDAALAAAQQLPREGFLRFSGSLLRAWCEVARNHTDAALAELGGFGEAPELAPLKHLHRGLILDVAGRTDEAAAAYLAAQNNGPAFLRFSQIIGNFLERTGKTAEADALYEKFNTSERGGDIALARTPKGIPAPLIATASAGLSEAFFDIASILNSPDAVDATIIHAQLSLAIDPSFTLARLILAEAQETDQRTIAALASYQAVDPASALGWTARLRVAALKNQIGDAAGSETDLRAMIAERPNNADAAEALADLLRAKESYAEAIPFYDEAILRAEKSHPARLWILHFSRGIAKERSGNFAAADIDLRRALSLKPGQPSILNYLGYSLIDRGEKLPEALDMIKQAVKERPNDGEIIDSLGWAYYRLGDYKNAQINLEKAVELRPSEAEINDHLGDVYWQIGRKEEAQLQWKRALTLKLTPQQETAIKAKLQSPPPRKGGKTAL